MQTTDIEYWNKLKEWTHITNTRIAKLQQHQEQQDHVIDVLESMVLRLSERVLNIQDEMEVR